MPDIRYALRNGDKTSSGGILIATGRSIFHHDLIVGVEGDHATCPACKVGGPVMNDCYPAVDVDGKQMLVTGARVNCKCPTHPVVIHSRTDFIIEVNRGGRNAPPPPSSASLASSNLTSPATGDYDEQVRVRAGNTPLEGYPYFIETPDGRAFSGGIGESGKLPRIYTENLNEYAIYWGDDALAKQTEV
ncbi:PAAR domain-containing protein [Cupriavidus sp. BIC8F]|uniref:PAAR domain-containing protein n=1 Tax=Cupriavidus sp. BIC8F TaxID=3079014 RepID=UPI002916FC80|nr:PAAR domain-containing protein [Cupriavidus sp. BIC8F]